MSKIRAEEIDIHFWIILDSRRSCGWVSGLWGCGEESRAEKLFSTCILCRACLLIPTQCLEYKSIFSWGPTAQQRLWRVLFFLMLLFYSFFFLSRVLYLHQNFNRGLSITSRSLYIFLNGPKSRRKKKKARIHSASCFQPNGPTVAHQTSAGVIGSELDGSRGTLSFQLRSLVAQAVFRLIL